MNRDVRTQPLLTEPLTPRPPQRVTEPLPEKPDQPRPASLTEPSATQPLPTAALVTERLATEPLPTLLSLPKPAASLAAAAPSTATEPVSETPLLVGRGIACEAAPSTATEQPVSEELVGEELAREPAVAIEEPPPVRAPFDSEPLRQLELLKAQIEQELRKSNPAYRPTPPPQLPAEPAEEPLELYLERFMERVTGKKLEPPAARSAAAAPEVPASPAVLAAVPAQPADSTTAEASVRTSSRPAAGNKPPSPPPVRPPETREKLSAMRDLANENTRNAFAEYAGPKQWQEARLMLLAATSASVVSSAYAAWHLASAPPGAMQSAVCAGLLAGLLACRFYLRCWQLTAATSKP